MDALEEYLRIEKLDATQVSDAAIKHKEESFTHLKSDYTEVESKGKHFIKEASEVGIRSVNLGFQSDKFTLLNEITGNL